LDLTFEVSFHGPLSAGNAFVFGAAPRGRARAMTALLQGFDVRSSDDVLRARRIGREIARVAGLDAMRQTTFAAALHELSRNARLRSGSARVWLALEGEPTLLCAHIEEPTQRPQAGAPNGADAPAPFPEWVGRLMDRFEVGNGKQGETTFVFGLRVPRAPVAVPARTIEKLVQAPPSAIEDEADRQSSELLLALEEVRRQQREAQRIMRQLDDTRRGMRSLFGELDEKSQHLHEASSLKSQFTKSISHELRTPIHSILNLTRLLLDRVDGPLTSEQEIQVGFIRKSAQSLSDMVNDLLELARVGAGRMVVRPAEFRLADLFAALRETFRAITSVTGPTVLVLEDPADRMPMHTDEGKLGQILRNLISNGLKFTERGEVRVAARAEAGDRVSITVSDTGIGIHSSDQERIFEEFTQLENPIQRQWSGAGLGLPIARELAVVLGGDITVESAPGHGSVFRVTIPRVFAQPMAPARGTETA
jgi:signal transduction histidine kinase